MPNIFVDVAILLLHLIKSMMLTDSNKINVTFNATCCHLIVFFLHILLLLIKMYISLV
jgi:hypothetical protein